VAADLWRDGNCQALIPVSMSLREITRMKASRQLAPRLAEFNYGTPGA